MLAGEEQANLTGVATHTAFYSAALDGEDFRETWDMLTICAAAVRNVVRRGVTEQVAMRISGYKTASVFYDIVSESDLAEAALKVESGAKAELARAGEIHSSFTVEQTEDETQQTEEARKPVQ
jgi:hypothetical protein